MFSNFFVNKVIWSSPFSAIHNFTTSVWTVELLWQMVTHLNTGALLAVWPSVHSIMRKTHFNVFFNVANRRDRNIHRGGWFTTFWSGSRRHYQIQNILGCGETAESHIVQYLSFCWVLSYLICSGSTISLRGLIHISSFLERHLNYMLVNSGGELTSDEVFVNMRGCIQYDAGLKSLPETSLLADTNRWEGHRDFFFQIKAAYNRPIRVQNNLIVLWIQFSFLDWILEKY